VAGFALGRLGEVILQMAFGTFQFHMGFTQRQTSDNVAKITGIPIRVACGTGFIEPLQWLILRMTTGTGQFFVETVHRPPGQLMSEPLTLLFLMTEPAGFF